MSILEELVLPMVKGIAITSGIVFGATYGVSQLQRMPAINEGVYWMALAQGNGYNDSGKSVSEITGHAIDAKEALNITKAGLSIGLLVGMSMAGARSARRERKEYRMLD